MAAKRALFGLPVAVDAIVLGSVLQLINWALTLVIWVTLIYVVISWVNPLAPVAPALSMLLRPLLGPIQRILPAIGGIDLSPMVLLIVVYLLQDDRDRPPRVLVTRDAASPGDSPGPIAERLVEALGDRAGDQPHSSARRWPRS